MSRQYSAARRSMGSAPRVSTASITSPDDLAMNSRLEQAVLELASAERPLNTRLALDTKHEEYRQFCIELYPDNDFKHVLCPEKMYRFMNRRKREARKHSGKVEIDLIGQLMMRLCLLLLVHMGRPLPCPSRRNPSVRVSSPSTRPCSHRFTSNSWQPAS